MLRSCGAIDATLQSMRERRGDRALQSMRAGARRGPGPKQPPPTPSTPSAALARQRPAAAPAAVDAPELWRHRRNAAEHAGGGVARPGTGAAPSSEPALQRPAAAPAAVDAPELWRHRRNTWRPRRLPKWMPRTSIKLQSDCILGGAKNHFRDKARQSQRAMIWGILNFQPTVSISRFELANGCMPRALLLCGLAECLKCSGQMFGRHFSRTQ